MFYRPVAYLLVTAFLGVSLVASEPGLVRAVAGTRPTRPLKPWTIIHPFSQPLTKYGTGHRGIDVTARAGQILRSPFSGRISWSGWVGSRNTLAVGSRTGLVFEAEPICSKLLAGVSVARGMPIGRVCSSSSYRSHCGVQLCVHLGLRDASGYFSLEQLFGDLPPSRLAFADG